MSTSIPHGNQDQNAVASPPPPPPPPQSPSSPRIRVDSDNSSPTKYVTRSLYTSSFLTSRVRSSSTSSTSSASSSSSSSSASSPISQTLLPPFYNRPPTPLPQSPSFTSLLRPPSFTHSRPTTPDSSDSEAATSSRIAQATPRAAPKVPTYEYYGFVLYLSSCIGFFLYILWSFLPASILHHIGVHYYYNRWWSLAVPAYLVMTIVYIYVALASYNTEYMTRPLHSLDIIVDKVAQVAVVEVDESKHYDHSPGCIGFGQFVKEPEEIVTDDDYNNNPTAASPVELHSPSPQKPPPSPSKHRKRRKRKRDGSGSGSIPGMSHNDIEEAGGEDHEMGALRGIMWKDYWNIGTDAVMDIPIGGVCEVLYGEGRDLQEY